MDGLGLADAVEPTDSLFQEFGVFRQVPKDEVMSKLEVPPFASDLRAKEYAGPFGVGKVGGLAIPLDKIQLFVELAQVQVDVFAYGFVNFPYESTGLANEKDFFVFVLGQPADQPLDLLIEGWGFFDRWVEGVENGTALGETSQDFAGIAEHDATGAKAIDDALGELRPIGRSKGGFGPSTGRGDEGRFFRSCPIRTR